MKYAGTFIAVIALLYCSVIVLRIPARDLSWAVQAYIIAQCVTHFFGLLGLQKRDAATDHYLVFFTACYAITVLLAMVVTGRMMMSYEFGVAVMVIAGCLGFTFVVMARTGTHILERYNDIPFALVVVLAQAGILLCCGLITLLSLMEQHNPAMSKSALALSLYWLAHSAYSFAFALGILKRVEVWVVRNEYIPAMLVIVFFGWLGFSLSGLQAETSRQAVSQQLHMEVAQ